MKCSLFTTLLMAGACALVGCGESHHHGHRHQALYKPGDGAINLLGEEVVIRAGGQSEEARVGIDGSLHIGEKPVDTSTEGRAALKQYDVAAVAIQQHAVALGKTGFRFGIDTLRNVLKGLFNGTAEEAGKHAEEGAHELVASVKELCGRLDGMYQAQQAAAGAIPEFKPYAVLSAKQVHECYEEHDRDFDSDDDDPRKST